MKKRISRNPAEQTPFERFYLEFPVLMERAGGVVYGANRLAEIGWGQRAAELLWDAMGRPDYRGQPMPPESHGGDWIGVADDLPPAKGLTTGEYCAICKAPQFYSPSGVTCKNGHGGADSVEGTRYWHHPESGSVFTTEPGEPEPTDGLVEQIDKDDYEKLKIEYGAEDDPFVCLEVEAAPEPDPFDIL